MSTKVRLRLSRESVSSHVENANQVEIQTWVSALEAYEAQEFDKALSVFATIADTSKIWFNIALIHATLGEHSTAIAAFKEATTRDGFLAVAAFQSGVSNFLLGRFKAAYCNFDAAYQQMRDNRIIDYEQIGLAFRLFSCEILFNRGLSRIYMGQTLAGLTDLAMAREQKQTAEHSVIDEAIRDEAHGFTVFSIPVGVLFRPSEIKVRNLAKRDYLGKATLVAAIDEHDTFTGFTGSVRQALEEKEGAGQRKNTSSSSPAPGDGPDLWRSPGETAGHTAALRLRRRPTDSTAHVNVPDAVSLLHRSGSESASDLHRAASEPMQSRSRARLQRSDSLPGHAPHLLKDLPSTPPLSTRSAPAPSDLSPSSSLYGSPRSSSSLRRPITPSAMNVRHRKHSLPRTATMPEIPQERDSVSSLVEAYGKHGNVASSASDEGYSPVSPLSTGRISAWAARAVKQPLAQTFNGTSQNLSRNESQRSRRHQRYEEDKGYESESIGSRQSMRVLDRIRLKIHHGEDIRGLLIDADLAWTELFERIETKFGATGLRLRFKDEDGSIISLVDAGDWDSAVDVARSLAGGKTESKLELFVVM